VKDFARTSEDFKSQGVQKLLSEIPDIREPLDEVTDIYEGEGNLKIVLLCLEPNLKMLVAQTFSP
jgi:hypothetical protein